MMFLDHLRHDLKSLESGDVSLRDSALDALDFAALALIERAPERAQSELTRRWLDRARLAAFAQAVRDDAQRRLGGTPSWRDIATSHLASFNQGSRASVALATV